MNGIVITWVQLLYISLILILFYVAELLLFMRKASAQRSVGTDPLEAELLRKEIAQLRFEMDALKLRLLATQAEWSQPAELVLDSKESPYSHAIRLAKLGADSNSVAHQCGISRGEADLIVALYRSSTQR
ncbi:DUF2802 domain-containing protein [Janthinobacterium sp. B9-8]|uniref:DUF2802 domain-containing protein n=1 Tax=Janthinobacterium sp. B9-8 TaxID=1236179 RepID=UPI00061D25C6|nr:DUF2802 domain-containing protein [Janthinobacterium sp. B9-8]AMC33687.1 hypothetical protein VN23_03285 [Janthinobacterium sp. B9-8]